MLRGGCRCLGVARDAGDLTVLAKADLRAPSADLAVSGVTGQGIDALLARIGASLHERAAGAGTVSHERQRQAVAAAAERARAAHAELLRAEPRAELVAEELRGALRRA